MMLTIEQKPLEQKIEQLEKRLIEVESRIRVDSELFVIYLLEILDRQAGHGILVSATSLEEAQSLVALYTGDIAWKDADVTILGKASKRFERSQVIKTFF